MSTTNPKFQVKGGATPVPNWLFDSKSLSGTEKLVAWGYHRSSFGSDTTTHTSEQHIAKTVPLDRKTVKKATRRLRQLGVLIADGRPERGFAQRYMLALEVPAALNQSPGTDGDSTPTPCGNGTHGGWGNDTHEGGEMTPTIKSRRAEKNIKDGSATLDGSALHEPRDEPTESHGDGNGEALPTLPATAGRNTLQSQRVFSKAEINAACLTPEGLRVNGNSDDLYYDLQNLVLPMVGGEHLNDAEFDRLVELRGVKFCQLWQHWLPRKVAWYYEKGEPVTKPTALYIRAVEQEWKVDPEWPEFDEKLHTWAAVAQAEVRAQYKERKRGAKTVATECIEQGEVTEGDSPLSDADFEREELPF